MYMMMEFNQKVSTWSVIIFILVSKMDYFTGNMIQETLWNWIYAFLLVITLHDMKANTVKTLKCFRLLLRPNGINMT